MPCRPSSGGPTSSRRWVRTEPTGLGGAGLRDRVRRAFWVDGASRAGPAATSRWRSTGRASPSTGSARTWATRSARAPSTPPRRRRSAHRHRRRLLDTFGVRTLGTGNGGFNPIGYHTGSVWTHDTAIVALGLAREGLDRAGGARGAVPGGLGRGLRLPVARALLRTAVAGPARALPRILSTAGLVGSLGRGHPDGRARPAGRPARGDPARRPPHPAPFGALRVEGLRLGGVPFAVDVDRDGVVDVTGVPEEVRISRGA